MSFDECIVIELKFGRKKIFFTVLYRSPASKQGSPEFELFLSNFKNLHTNIMSENPYATFLLEILMVIPSSGGLKGTPTPRVEK